VRLKNAPSLAGWERKGLGAGLSETFAWSEGFAGLLGVVLAKVSGQCL